MKFKLLILSIIMFSLSFSLFAKSEFNKSSKDIFNWGGVDSICSIDHAKSNVTTIESINFVEGNSANVKFDGQWHHIYHDDNQNIDAAKNAFILQQPIKVCYSRVDGRIFIIEYVR